MIIIINIMIIIIIIIDIIIIITTIITTIAIIIIISITIIIFIISIIIINIIAIIIIINIINFPVRVNKELNSIRFDVLSISKVLKNLKPSVSFGLNNIPNIFLRRTERSITWPLSILFERSLSANYIPALWKMAKVVPCIKKDRLHRLPIIGQFLSYPASLQLWNV